MGAGLLKQEKGGDAIGWSNRPSVPHDNIVPIPDGHTGPHRVEPSIQAVSLKPYYDEDGITIYHSDCREILPQLGKVDVVITDPPYEAEAHTLQRRLKRTGGVLSVEPLTFRQISEEIRNESAGLIGNLTRRWALVFCQVEAAGKWRRALQCGGMIYRRTCIWVKPDAMPQLTGDRPAMGYESLLAMHAKGRSQWNGGGRHGVFTFSKRAGDGCNLHPTEKPEPLMRQLVGLFSNSSEVILDPFCGSGTTLVAAKNLGRRAIGIEIEEKYCEIAVNRLRQSVFSFVRNGHVSSR